MSGFILYRSDFPGDLPAARAAFARKGARLPQSHHIGGWKVELGQKVTKAEASVRFSERHRLIAVFGSPLLPGLGFSDTRRRILDLDTKIFDIRQHLLGHFVILVADEGGLYFYQDSFGIQRIYALETGDFFSSSFLATAWACPSKLTLNEEALAEKLATGETLGDETIFQQVVRCAPGQAPFQGNGPTKLTLHRKACEMNPGAHDSFSSSIEANSQLLAQTLGKVETAAKMDSALLGISSGYDSRLLLAAATKAAVPLTLFTHHTRGVHSQEHRNIDRIAGKVGMTPLKPESQPIEQLSGSELERMADDCLHYFDGCTSRQRGALQETFTRNYYQKVFTDHSIFFNGIGGEIFRNHTGSSHRRIHLDAWLDRHVFFPFGQEMLGSSLTPDEVRSRIRDHLSRRLGVEFGRFVSLLDLRRFYSTIRVPDSDANILNAHSQLVDVFAPFTEPEVIAGGLAATPLIGLGGEYEAALITELCAELGDIPFNDGFGPGLQKRTYQFRNVARAHVPSRLALARIRRRLLRGRAQAEQKFWKLKASSGLFRDIEQVLMEVIPPQQFPLCLLHFGQRPATLYLGLVLLHFHDRIRW